MEALLTPREAADILRVSWTTLRDWRSAKTGPAYVMVGGRPRYRSADLESWLAQHAVEVAAR